MYDWEDTIRERGRSLSWLDDHTAAENLTLTHVSSNRGQVSTTDRSAALTTGCSIRSSAESSCSFCDAVSTGSPGHALLFRHASQSDCGTR
ncbi:hypothetical protein A5695_13815 [Mycobacterium sp. E1747]|nr:hypothetical protein A5695_13815 [Mycobacterium sp. E1747]